jgi:hypothetical protein
MTSALDQQHILSGFVRTSGVNCLIRETLGYYVSLLFLSLADYLDLGIASLPRESIGPETVIGSTPSIYAN